MASFRLVDTHKHKTDYHITARHHGFSLIDCFVTPLNRHSAAQARSYSVTGGEVVFTHQRQIDIKEHKSVQEKLQGSSLTPPAIAAPVDWVPADGPRYPEVLAENWSLRVEAPAPKPLRTPLGFLQVIKHRNRFDIISSMVR